MLFHKDLIDGHEVQQLVLPQSRILSVMKLGHNHPTASHYAEQRTRNRVQASFYWPGMRKDLSTYVKSCTDCQLRARARTEDRVPITPMVRPDLLWVRVHMDCIGPLNPVSSKGHAYALCIVDDCTRWPAVYLLKSLTAKAACDSLLDLLMITGLPSIIVSDQGSNFISSLTQEFLTRLGVTPRFNSPGRPAASGVVERFNGVFKNLLHHAIKENGRQWHRAVPFLLWAVRSVPNATTGMSPHTLLFGRSPRGPLQLMQEHLTGQRNLPNQHSKSVDEYLNDLQKHLNDAADYADKHSTLAQQKYAHYYNVKAKDKHFELGEKVVILEKDSTHKLFARWQLGGNCQNSFSIQLLC